jgi:uncharacterized protein YndB with AHSA1/START domain
VTVTNVTKDPEKKTLSITTELDAPVARVWELWDDPRQLERWWGPPTYPATFVDHDLTPGFQVNYFMTGPEGDQSRGWWRIVAVDPPNGLEFEDGFSDGDGNPNPDMPVMIIRVALEAMSDGKTRMTIESTFSSSETMQQMLTMGMAEGMAEAMGQIDALLTG